MSRKRGMSRRQSKKLTHHWVVKVAAATGRKQICLNSYFAPALSQKESPPPTYQKWECGYQTRNSDQKGLVREYLGALNELRSPGPDGRCHPQSLRLKSFEKSWSSGKVPEVWSTANMLLIKEGGGSVARERQTKYTWENPRKGKQAAGLKPNK